MEISTLIIKCQQGDIMAQQCLLRELNTISYITCRRYAKSDQETKEIRIEVFRKILQSLPTFIYQNDAAFMGWVKKILINQCLKHGQRSRSFLELVDDLPEDGLVEMDVFATIDLKDIMLALSRLPTGYRLVFNMYVIDGYTHKEIAEKLMMEEGTSRSQLSKARMMLQRILQPKIEHHEKNRE